LAAHDFSHCAVNGAVRRVRAGGVFLLRQGDIVLISKDNFFLKDISGITCVIRAQSSVLCVSFLIAHST
jgi:hypothetical protein